MRDLHELPTVKDSLSYIYLEHAKIEQDGHAIAFFDKSGKTPVPCAALHLIMIGPGTSITHSAIKNILDNGCLIMWTGEEGVRYYGTGMGETRSARNTIRQAQLVSIPYLRKLVAMNMYSFRFKEHLEKNVDIKTLRGREGARMRKAYQSISKSMEVPWKGRNYNRKKWNEQDPINQALSVANSCLYGICHAAIIAMGYNPALGFIHTGKQLSFVYDIGDLYKAEITIPLAFKMAKESSKNIATRTRIACREKFREKKLLKFIVKDIATIMNIDHYLSNSDKAYFDRYLTQDINFDTEDGALPGGLWDPSLGIVEGGKNFEDTQVAESIDEGNN